MFPLPLAHQLTAQVCSARAARHSLVQPESLGVLRLRPPDSGCHHAPRPPVGVGCSRCRAHAALELGDHPRGGASIRSAAQQEVRGLVSMPQSVPLTRMMSDSPRLLGFVQTTLPSLAMVAFNNFLPMFLEALSVWQGLPARSWIELSQLKKYHISLLFTTLFVFVRLISYSARSVAYERARAGCDLDAHPPRGHLAKPRQGARQARRHAA